MSDSHLSEERVRAFDASSGVARDEVLRHAALCRTCRERLVADDPTRLFALLGTVPVPGEALERLSSGLDAQLDRIDPRSRSEGRRPGWVALAASLLLAAVAGGYLLSRPGNVSPPLPTASAEMPRVEQYEAGGIELLSPPDAEVYDLTVGEAQIVMIFNEKMDI